MNAQAVQLKDYVNDLIHLVTGKGLQQTKAITAGRTTTMVAASSQNSIKRPMISQNSNEISTDQIISFDDTDDLREF
jgi:methyl-accepting chemotaxis protein